MIRLALPFVFLLAFAPVQCTSKYDPATAREETAGDGLWSLAEDFRAKGNQDAFIATLRFLVTRYPASRRAPKARDELEKAGVHVPNEPAPARTEAPLKKDAPASSAVAAPQQ